MELTISQRKFSADGAIEGKGIIAQLTNRHGISYSVQFPSSSTPTGKTSEIRFKIILFR